MDGLKLVSRRTSAFALLVTLAAAAAGCSTQPVPTTTPTQSASQTASETPTPTPTDNKIRVVSSVAVWAEIAKQIGGDLVDSTAIVESQNQDPHSYEATVRDQLAVNQAQVTIENGAGYDTFFHKLVTAKPANAGNVNLLASSILIPGLPLRPDTNPHFWYDFAFANVMAKSTYQALVKVAPASDTTALTANYKKLSAAIDDLTARAKTLRTKTFDSRVLLTEPFAAFTLDALGMRNMIPQAFANAVEAETDASPAVMNQIKTMITRHQVKLVILNQQTTGAQTSQISAWATSTGVPVIELSELLPAHTSYVTWMKRTLTAISGAIK